MQLFSIIHDYTYYGFTCIVAIIIRIMVLPVLWLTLCADPRNHKYLSMTQGVDQAAGILRQHDTLSVLPIPDVFFAHKMLTSTSENSDKVQ